MPTATTLNKVKRFARERQKDMRSVFEHLSASPILLVIVTIVLTIFTVNAIRFARSRSRSMPPLHCRNCKCKCGAEARIIRNRRPSTDDDEFDQVHPYDPTYVPL